MGDNNNRNNQIVRVFQNSLEAKGRATITVFSLDSGFIAVDNENNTRHSISSVAITETFDSLFADARREIEKKLGQLKTDDAMDIGIQITIRSNDGLSNNETFNVDTPLDLGQILDAVNDHYRRQGNIFGAKGSLMTPVTEQSIFQALKDAGAIKVILKEKTNTKQTEESRQKVDHPSQASFNAKAQFDGDKGKTTFKA